RKTGHTVQSDLYSLGVVAYELLAGQRPFTGTDPFDLGLAHINDPVPPMPASVPPWLRDLVTRLLAKEPQERYPSAQALIAALNSPRPQPAPAKAEAPPPAR
ncbi:protein kinase, partial [Arthrospira platensis SPKY2]